MNLVKSLIFEDITNYKYFLTPKFIKNYQRNKILLALLPLLWLLYMNFTKDFSYVYLVPVAMAFCYKIPYIMMRLQHNQNSNDVVRAIPLWINQIYALIEINTIHNAIINSLGDNTPLAIKKDLTAFIEKINKSPKDKSAYLDFLDRYKIDGFSDIMLKLYEFNNLSKEKLKYEIRNLNHDLGKIEAMKRQARFKNETFMCDIGTCFIIFIPCMYLSVISMMPSLFMM